MNTEVATLAALDPGKEADILSAIEFLEGDYDRDVTERAFGVVQLAISLGTIGQNLTRACAAKTRSYQRFSFDPNLPIQSTRPLTFLTSYPRSGNTFVQLALGRYGGTHCFSAMEERNCFAKTFYPRDYPYRRIVKDHVLRPEYDTDRTVALIRDGRDTVLSLAYMTRFYGHHQWDSKESIADFIRFTHRRYIFGPWSRFAGRAVERRGQPHFLLEKYEDLVADSQALVRIFEFIFDGEPVDKARVSEEHARSDDNVSIIRNTPGNEGWGYDAQFDENSMFYRWSQNRKASNWRETWDKAARQAFHETGATDYLIELGYENDPNWWR